MSTQSLIREIIRNVTVEITNILIDELRHTLSHRIKKEERKVSKRRKIQRRRWWVRPHKYEELAKELAITDSVVDHKGPISDGKFEELLTLISHKIQKQDTVMREAIAARTKLKIVLHYLSTGENFQILSALYRLPKSSISQFMPTVCHAICEGLEDFNKVPSSEDEWLAIQQTFANKWNFATCCGAIDGGYITTRCTENGSQTAIVLSCVVDSHYNFIHVDVESKNNSSDSLDFSISSFENKLQELDIPKDGVFVANDSFPLMENILTPYNFKNITSIQRVFNYRLERANRIAENALGLLGWKFPVLERAGCLKIDTIKVIFKTICTLQNWLLKTTDTYMNSQDVDIEDYDAGTIIPGKWRQSDNKFRRMKYVKNNNIETAIIKRNLYAKKFIETDTVAWQWDMVQVEPITV